MYICNKIGQNKKKGSIVLEMAIAMPVFIIIAAIILTAITCVHADISFSHAVDQVSGEVAVMIPVMGAGIDVISEISSFLPGNADNDEKDNDGLSGLAKGLGIVSAITEYAEFEIEDYLGTFLFGQALKNRIEETFDSLCDGDVICRDRIQDVSVFIDYDQSESVVWIRVYYQWVTPFGSFDKMIQSVAPIYGDLEMELPDDEDTQSDDEIWDQSNFARGLYFRNRLGANLPSNFPVIATWENFTATSIKSIDLTAPTYQNNGNVTDKIYSHIDDLSQFSGTEQPWGEEQIIIHSEDIHNKELIIIIPANSEESVKSELEACKAYAENCDVDLVIVEIGNSNKYLETNTNHT